MSNGLKPWAYGPFELLRHAEMHLRAGEDFDRRMALISFDNAIEVAITTYLSLHPLQRQNREYPKVDVERWLQNYHTKIDFFLDEVGLRALPPECDKAEIVWYHRARNNQYHGGGAAVPLARAIQGIRQVAFRVFSVLFDIDDVPGLLESYISQDAGQQLFNRTGEYDRLIDEEYGLCEIHGDPYYTSEALYAIDPIAYTEEGLRLKSIRDEQVRVEVSP